MKRSTVFTIATVFFLIMIAIAILGEYFGGLFPLPLSVELIGTSMGVALGLSIAEMAKSFTEEESEETIRRRLLKELTRLAIGKSITRNLHYYTPVWDSIVSNGKDDMLDDVFLESVFEVYNEIDYLNVRMTRQNVSEWEAYPLLEKILGLLEKSGDKVQIESVRKKIETLYEKTPEHAKKKET